MRSNLPAKDADETNGTGADTLDETIIEMMMVEELVLLDSKKRHIRAEDLQRWVDAVQDKDVYDRYVEHHCFRKKTPLDEIIRRIEKMFMIYALSKFDGSRTKASRYLSMEYNTFLKKLKKYEIEHW